MVQKKINKTHEGGDTSLWFILSKMPNRWPSPAASLLYTGINISMNPGFSIYVRTVLVMLLGGFLI